MGNELGWSAFKFQTSPWPGWVSEHEFCNLNAHQLTKGNLLVRRFLRKKLPREIYRVGWVEQSETQRSRDIGS